MLHGEKINAVDQLMQKEIFYILDNYVHRYVYVKNALLMEEEVFKESYGMDFGNEIDVWPLLPFCRGEEGIIALAQPHVV